MKLLLDTHAVIWAVAAPRHLPDRVVDAVADQANQVLVSVASAWEVAIKRALGKLEFDDITSDLLARFGFDRLEIGLRHTSAVGELPDLHTDPFDRMLVAQATTDDLVLVTRDPRIGEYDVEVLW